MKFLRDTKYFWAEECVESGFYGLDCEVDVVWYFWGVPANFEGSKGYITALDD